MSLTKVLCTCALFASLLLAFGCLVPTLQAADAAAPKLNVLLIAVDDLRPQLGCYGDTVVKTPNIDRLASRGVVFSRAYCQQALCSPSRISLLSGRYPGTTKIFQIGPPLRSTMPDIITMPQHFKNNGHFARSIGKVYHVGIDDPTSWSVESVQGKKPRWGPQGQAMIAKARADAKAAGKTLPEKGEGALGYAGPAFESPDVGDDDLVDGDICRLGVAALGDLAAKPDQPFFLAVGFHNPHVPWIAPKKYWDLYRSADLKLPENNFPPRDAPKYAAASGADFYWYATVPKDRIITPEFGRDCLHGYLASISYVDALVGRLVAALEEKKLADRTVIVLWGDHGYYMGEHSWWGGKHNNYEGATHAPLIVSVPGAKAAGKKANGLVEFVDIYPTLAEVCALPAPQGTQGHSFSALLNDASGPGKEAAYSWYPKGGKMGRTVRTDRWRYVEWTDPKSGTVVDVELYDESADPQENQNISGRPEHKELLGKLHELLQKAPGDPHDHG
jgi:arylsulfatase A-like enzyme